MARVTIIIIPGYNTGSWPPLIRSISKKIWKNARKIGNIIVTSFIKDIWVVGIEISNSGKIFMEIWIILPRKFNMIFLNFMQDI